MEVMSYFTIAFGGFAVLALSVFFGGDSDADVEIDVDADVDIDADADADVGIGGGGVGFHWFSVKVWAAFATAFGAGGAIARTRGVGTGWSLVIAVASGVVLGAIVNSMITFICRQQSSSSFSDQSFIGKEGEIVLGIRPDSIGRVRAQIGSTVVTRSARSEDGGEIVQGQRVEIVSAGAQFVVKKLG